MHGLGADAQDMAGLAAQLPVGYPVRHVFLDAPIRPVTLNNRMPMRAWYDIIGLTLSDREDSEGIKQSEEFIREIIQRQAEQFTFDKIYLAGFSQGGAMALFTGLHTKERLGGIIALSAYLPLASNCEAKLDKKTPFFMANGLYDQVVSPLWTKESVNIMKQKGFQDIMYKEYPMEHSICAEEAKDLAQWLTKKIAAKGQGDGDNNDNG
jgi:phospholipase/carboxylesterase